MPGLSSVKGIARTTQPRQLYRARLTAVVLALISENPVFGRTSGATAEAWSQFRKRGKQGIDSFAFRHSRDRAGRTMRTGDAGLPDNPAVRSIAPPRFATMALRALLCDNVSQIAINFGLRAIQNVVVGATEKNMRLQIGEK